MALFDPAEETIEGLATWPEQELVRLVRAVAVELKRRQFPQPVALPLIELIYGSLYERVQPAS
jgi:hypothetical protein